MSCYSYKIYTCLAPSGLQSRDDALCGYMRDPNWKDRNSFLSYVAYIVYIQYEYITFGVCFFYSWICKYSARGPASKLVWFPNHNEFTKSLPLSPTHDNIYIKIHYVDANKEMNHYEWKWRSSFMRCSFINFKFYM